MAAKRSAWILGSGAVLMLLSHSALASDVCPRSPEEAATTFMTWGVDDPQRTVELVQPANLELFRSRLQQVMDDRYSPDSAAFRQGRLGSEWSQERMITATDKELVGKYFLGVEPRRQNKRISEVRVVESRQVRFADREVVVSYVAQDSERKVEGRQKFAANQVGDCWLVQFTVDAWAVLEQVADILKKSREETSIPRQGASRVKLQIVEGSRTEREGMRLMPDAYQSIDVWLSPKPLLTQDDVVSASAAWDCDTSDLGPEEATVKIHFSPEGADALRRWTEVNIDSMLAVVLDSRVVTFARVTGALGSRMAFCLSGKSLEEAQGVAADLVGAH